MSESKLFGTLPDGREVHEYVLRHANGFRMTVLDLGATVNSVRLQGDDPSSEVAIGFADLEEQREAAHSFFGAVIGRYANRIANGRFTLDGVQHQVTQNEGTTALHGGTEGFDSRTWTVAHHSDEVLALELTSPDGDQGFPGTVSVRATYRLVDDPRNAQIGFVLDLTALSDAPTICALTSHLYLNLAGGGTVLDHHLTVDADGYLPIDAASIPLGVVQPVDGTPFDLREGARIGDRVVDPHPQVKLVGGIDHSFDLVGSGIRRAALLVEPTSGRTLEVWTDQPGLQVYTGNFLDGLHTASTGQLLTPHTAVALEPQQHPDTPNQAWGRSAELRPGQVYTWHGQWRFTR